MQVSRIEPAQSEDRGSITDILVREQVKFVTLIHSKKDAVRGNHYHKETFQWVYVLTGQIRVHAQ